jgi:spore maturation protein SpmA
MINTHDFLQHRVTHTITHKLAPFSDPITSSLYDKDTPLEAIILLLCTLHEQSQAIQNAHTQDHMQTLQEQIEARQKHTLDLLEKSINKQLDLQAYKETASLGKLIQKSLLAVMATMAAVSTTGIFMPAVVASVALFTAADAAIDLISYAQVQLGGYTPEQTWAKQIKDIFDEVLTQHTDTHPTWISYIADMRSLLMAAILVGSNMIYSNVIPLGVHIGQVTLSVAEGFHDIQVGRHQSQMAEISADQKINQALQDMLQQQLRLLQKGVGKQHKALEEVITSTSDALNQQWDSTRYINRNMI